MKRTLRIVPTVIFIACSVLITFSRLVDFQYEASWVDSENQGDFGRVKLDERIYLDQLLVMNHTQANYTHDHQLEPNAKVLQFHTNQHKQHRWENEHDIVHVVYTRFMQHQPDLLHLGMARLKLFETFCFPTMRNQSSNKFLWMIRTDPALHPTLRQGILKVVENMTNVVIIGSNDIRKGSLPDKSFRSPLALEDVTPQTVFYGSSALVKAYHEAAKNRTLIETNLDADDGLALSYVKTIQQRTFMMVQQQQQQQKVPNDEFWFNWCIGKHLEWQFFVPFDNDTSKGYLRLGSTHLCVTPGLAWVTGPTNKVSDTKFVTGHHLIKKQSKECMESQYTNCWRELPMDDSTVMAVRARSPTSTGMNTVVLPSDRVNADNVQKQDAKAWPLFTASFGISLDNVVEARQFLEDDLKNLVEENLKGQCQKDHSCSEGINKQLKLAAPRSEHWVNKYNVVHTVHTWLAFDEKNSTIASNQLNVFKTFTLTSMEQQTTMDFLWIVRIATSSIPDLESQLRKTFARSPVNVLLVRTNQGNSTMDPLENLLDVHETIQNSTVSGSNSLLQDYAKASRTRSLLETFLSPTDAFSKHFLEQRQNESSTALEFQGGRWICPKKYMEWSLFSPIPTDDVGFLYTPESLPSKVCNSDWPGATRIVLQNNASNVDLCENNTSDDCLRWSSSPWIDVLHANLSYTPGLTNADKQSKHHRSLANTLREHFGFSLGDIRSMNARIKMEQKKRPNK